MNSIKILKVIAFACACYFFSLVAVVHADPLNPLTGTYYGSAMITSPATLGTIDLAFYLDVSGTAILHDTSYVIIEKTLHFSVCQTNRLCSVSQSACTANSDCPSGQTCDSKTSCNDPGPHVSGSLSGTSRQITIDPFQSKVIDKYLPNGDPLMATRNITLTITQVTNGGASLSGNYQETITGIGSGQVVTSGGFVLLKPSSSPFPSIQDGNGDGCIDLAEIKAGGNDPNVVEFEDMSSALHIFNYPTPTVKICGDTTAQVETIRQALNDYYTSTQN